jgi:hypothetical protein
MVVGAIADEDAIRVILQRTIDRWNAAMPQSSPRHSPRRRQTEASPSRDSMQLTLVTKRMEDGVARD